MNNFSIISAVLIISCLANNILCNYENIQSLTDDEKRALTRDNLARDNPDALLSGFFPAWGVVIYMLSGSFLILAIVSGVLYLFGCRNSNDNQGFRVVENH